MGFQYGRTDASFVIPRELRELVRERRRRDDRNMSSAFPLGTMAVDLGCDGEHNTLTLPDAAFFPGAAIRAQPAFRGRRDAR